jgi:CheY-like chemotaxis protein
LKFTNNGFIELGYTLQANNIVIYVKDTGIGIHPEKQELIFERFSQEEKEMSQATGGLGLGLSIAKENAELIDGEITLESEKGKGATFYVSIPYQPTKPKNAVNSKRNGQTSNSKKASCQTILVAEDEEVNFIFLEILLSEFDDKLKIIHAINGQDAIDLYHKNKNVNLILMDIKMPVMNGIDATIEIRKFNQSIPIIAQTAYSTIQDREEAIAAGCSDFISKPIKKERLLAITNSYLKQ